MQSTSLIPTALLTLALTASLSAEAKQIVKGAEKQPVEVVVSAREQNVISVEGGKIYSIVPSSADALVYEKDERQGALYFTLANQATLSTVTLFVVDDQNNRYRLVLTPKNIAAEDIVIVPAPNSAVADVSSSENRAGSFVSRLKRLMMIMVSYDGSDVNSLEGVQVEKINKDIKLWKEGNLVQLYRFTADDLVGEVYQLKNVSSESIQMVEQEFFRKSVAAVAVKNLNLAPGETTLLYVERVRHD